MKQLMLGNEAIARGAYEAGCKGAFAYPGTPSTEITEHIARYKDIYTEWAPNEKVALEAAAGASFAGGRALYAGKHVGLNVAADPLFTLSYTGVNGGLVIITADDPGMHSSQNEQDNRHYARASKLPMLEPSSSQECKDFVKLAFEMSEQFDTPVIIRLTTRIAHSRSIVELGEPIGPVLKPYIKDPAKYVMVPANARARHIFVEERIQKLKKYAENTPVNQMTLAGRKNGIITAGIAYQYAREAFPEASFLKLGQVYPLPEQLIRSFAAQVEQIIVIEELDPFIEDAVNAMGIQTWGKEQLSLMGEYSPSLLREKLKDEKPAAAISAGEAPPRPPALCPGCPHRGVFYVLKKLKLTVSGDIGCYTLGVAAPYAAIDTTICMGGGVSVLHGMEKANPAIAESAVGIIGDSTFIHSGITGLIDVVYNRGTATLLILDNSTTGMTGHQNNPLNGLDIKGNPAPSVDLEGLCRSIGVHRVFVIDPFDVKGLENKIKEELSIREPSVIIARRPCVLLKSVKAKPAKAINTDACKNCGLCVSIACPAIEKSGGNIRIHQNLCNGCGLCSAMCAFGAIEEEGQT